MTKQATYLRAVKALPDYFVDEQTRLACVDDDMMVAANPRFAPMWYDAKHKKVKWRALSQKDCPITFNDDGSLTVKEKK